MYALCESRLSGCLQAEAMAFRRICSTLYTHSNIQLNIDRALWKYTEWWASSRSNGLQKKFFKSIYIFKHTIDQSMRSVKVQWVVGFKYNEWLSEEVIETLYSFKHTIEKSMRSLKVQWVVGFKQKQWFSEEFFLINIHIQTYKWTKYALCESTVSGGLQAEAMGFRRSFSKHFTHSNIQFNNVCALWK